MKPITVVTAERKTALPRREDFQVRLDLIPQILVLTGFRGVEYFAILSESHFLNNDLGF